MIPYEFVLEYLYPLEPIIKPMFGVQSIYLENKIYFAVRKNESKPIDNGLWLATSLEHQDSLREQFPSLRDLSLYKIKKWLLLPEEAEDFETSVITICELIKSGDPRIGVIPKIKKKPK